MTNSSTEGLESERLTISSIAGLVLKGWKVIVVLSVFFALIVLYVSATSQAQYRSYFTVMPAPTNSDALRMNSSPASFLGNTKSPDWEMYLAVLTSTTVAERLANDHQLMTELFDGNWDKEQQRWKPLPTFWQLPFSGKINAVFGQRTDRTPDKFAVYGYLQHYLSVTPIPQTSMVTVSLDGPRPDLAVRILKELHSNTNDIVRETRLSRAVGQRTHLLGELEKTTVADYTIILQQLLSRVESDIMTASIKGQYAGALVDGPISIPAPVFPRPFLFLQLAIVGGVVVGLILVVFTPLTDAHFLLLWAWVRNVVSNWTKQRLQRSSDID